MSVPYSHKFLIAVHSLAVIKLRQCGGSEVEGFYSESSRFSSSEFDLFIQVEKSFL